MIGYHFACFLQLFTLLETNLDLRLQLYLLAFFGVT